MCQLREPVRFNGSYLENRIMNINSQTECSLRHQSFKRKFQTVLNYFSCLHTPTRKYRDAKYITICRRSRAKLSQWNFRERITTTSRWVKEKIIGLSLSCKNARNTRDWRNFDISYLTLLRIYESARAIFSPAAIIGLSNCDTPANSLHFRVNCNHRGIIIPTRWRLETAIRPTVRSSHLVRDHLPSGECNITHCHSQKREVLKL